MNEKFKISAEKKKWADAIEHLTDAQVKIALIWCRDHEEYLPTVARFKFKAHALVDSTIAFEVATAHHECVAIREAFGSIGSYEWSHSSDTQLRRKFLGFYTLACDRVIKGELVERYIQQEIECEIEPKSTPTIIDREERSKIATKYMAKINNILGNPKPKKDAVAAI